MTDFKVNVEFDASVLTETFNRMIAAGQNLSPLMADIAEGWNSRTQDRFDTQHAPDGSAWQPLTAKHLAKKKRKGYPETLLVMEARLRDELRPDSGADFAEVATAPLPYAAIHQFGGQSWMAPGPASIPARPFLGASPDDLEWIEGLVTDYFERSIGGNAL